MDFNSVRYQLALQLRQWQEEHENKRCDMYNAWDEKIYEPIARQTHDHVNNTRAEKQRQLGKKAVAFQLGKPKAYVRSSEDPAKQLQVSKVQEDEFIRESEGVLGPKLGQRSCSAPSIIAPISNAPGMAGASCDAAVAQRPLTVPLASSRPILDPVEWNPI